MSPNEGYDVGMALDVAHKTLGHLDQNKVFYGTDGYTLRGAAVHLGQDLDALRTGLVIGNPIKRAVSS